jgi:hypothetical protein
MVDDIREDHADAARLDDYANHVCEGIEVLIVTVGVQRHVAPLFDLEVEATLNHGGVRVRRVARDVTGRDISGSGTDGSCEDAREGEGEIEEAHLDRCAGVAW